MDQTYEQQLEVMERADLRRRRRWRRAWLVIGALLVALLVLRFWWGRVADRRLSDLIEAYHAAGEPILLDDFARHDMPRDEENAARLYEDAAVAVAVPTGTEVTGTAFLQDFRLAFTNPEDSRRWVEANAELRRLMSAAEKLPKCDWGMRVSGPTARAFPPTLSFLRNLQRTNCGLAVAHHAIGDDSGCISMLMQTRRLNERMMTPTESTVISHLIAAACDALLCRAIEYIAPGLAVRDATPDTVPLSGPAADRHDVEALIASLLDESDLSKGWYNALTGERACTFDTLRQMQQGGSALGVGGVAAFVSGIHARVLAPAFQLDAVLVLRRMTLTRDAGLAASFPAATRGLDFESIRGSGDPSVTFLELQAHPISAWTPSLHSSHSRLFALRAERRLAATALAIRLYELDHGIRPGTLDDLVPGYLGTVPVDPFAEPSHPLRYAPDHRPALLYSVYINGKDEGGQPRGHDASGAESQLGDLLFYLDGERPMDPIVWENVLVNPPGAPKDGAP